MLAALFAPKVHSHTPTDASVDHPAGTEDPSKSTVTVVAPSPGPHTNTGAVTSDIITVAEHELTFPEASVTNTSTTFSPKLVTIEVKVSLDQK